MRPTLFEEKQDEEHFEKGRIVRPHPDKTYCFIEMEDERKVFLHRNDFAGDWPPKHHKLVKFKLVRTSHPKCEWKANEAELCGAKP